MANQWQHIGRTLTVGRRFAIKMMCSGKGPGSRLVPHFTALEYNH